MTNKAGKITLHDCVENGNLDKLTTFLDLGLSPDELNRYGQTPLHKAAELGCEEIVTILITHGAKVNVKDTEYGMTPLHLGASEGHKEIVELLISHGADVNAKANIGLTPIHVSACEGQTEIVEILISYGAVVNVKDTIGHTPLHDSAWKGHKDVVEVLISYGAEVNVKDNDGQSPLHVSACEGHKEIVEILINHGADVNIKNTFRQTPLHKAAFQGHEEIVDILINHGADLNVKNTFGQTPLHGSVYHGYKEIVEILLSHRADVNMKDDDGQTALYGCTSHGHNEIVEILISHGTDVNVKDKRKETPLHFSAMNGHIETVKLLIKHGAEIDPKDKWGDIPLVLAEKRGHQDIVDILRQAKHVQAGDSIFRRVKTAFFGYSSSTRRRVSIQGSDGKGQITKVKYESEEVRCQVTGVSDPWTEPNRRGNVAEAKVNEYEDIQGHIGQDVLRNSFGISTYLTTSESDVCTPGWPAKSKPAATASFSATTSEFSTTSTSTQEFPLTSTRSISTTTVSSLESEPTPEQRDEVTYLAQKLMKAVKNKRKPGEDDGGLCQDQDSFNVLSDQLGGNVIIINNQTVHNHYHNTYYNNREVSCEEIKVETTETLDVSVGNTTYCDLLHPPESYDYEKEDEYGYIYEAEEGKNTKEDGTNRQTFDAYMTDKPYLGLQVKEATNSEKKTWLENTTNGLETTDNTSLCSVAVLASTLTVSSAIPTTSNALSQSSTTTTTTSSSLSSSSSATATTTATEIRRRLENQAGYMEKMVQSCVAGGGVGQSSDLAAFHHGGVHVPVNLNFIMQPKNVEVYSTKQVNCEKVDVEKAENVASHCQTTIIYGPQQLSDDEDEDNTDDDSSGDTEIHIEDSSD